MNAAQPCLFLLESRRDRAATELSIVAERIADTAVAGTLPNAIDIRLYTEAKERFEAARTAIREARRYHSPEN